MKSYLSLIPISAKVHRRQNCMTVLCIIFAVFLVTVIFSTAEMGVRSEAMHTKESHGDWQIRIENITEKEAKTIESRSDVAAASWYDVVNLDMDKQYLIDGRQTVLCGIEESFRTDIMSYFDENSSIQADNEVILTPNAKELIGADIGSDIVLDTPAGSYKFHVTGFRSDDSRYVTGNGGETTALLVKQEKQIGAFINISTFRKIIHENGDSGNASYYVQFKKHANIKKAMNEIKKQCGITDTDIEQNSIFMGLAGLSDNTMIRNLYPLVFFLFFLVLLAGVLMISGSLNSTIAQRTEFFGMMRCIGMSKQQVIHFVRLEALNWCKVAIPIGVLLGIITSWILNAVLKYFVGGEFSEFPVFGVSVTGIISGVLIGISTVWIAAQSPAKRASKVSPIAAVTGNIDDKKKQHRAKLHFLRIESTLGVSHAISAKKNLILMSGSFALSIILFLCFSVLVELLGYLLPTSVASPDLSIVSSDRANTIDHQLIDKISEMEGVNHVFGRMYQSDIPAKFYTATKQNTVDLISYSELQLDWLPEDDMLKKGSDLSKVYGDSSQVLAIWDEKSPINIGDKIQLGDFEVEIAGMLKYSPFSNSGRTNGEIILICSEETFTRLTGEQAYSIIDIQVKKSTTDEEVSAIHNLIKGKYEFQDRRDEGDRSTYWAFSLFIYGFLIIIVLITVLNIINSISMSVTARTKQYGAMRAVGMDGWQLTKMIAAEAFTYALVGGIIGCIVGLPLNKFMYDKIITTHYPYYTWSVPVQALLIIIFFVAGATIISVYAPSKRIRNMAVTNTINEL